MIAHVRFALIGCVCLVAAGGCKRVPAGLLGRGAARPAVAARPAITVPPPRVGIRPEPPEFRGPGLHPNGFTSTTVGRYPAVGRGHLTSGREDDEWRYADAERQVVAELGRPLSAEERYRALALLRQGLTPSQVGDAIRRGG